MKPENQVCTFEQAKEFDGYGLKVDSYFVWYKTKPSSRSPVFIYKVYPGQDIAEDENPVYFKAYSSAELDYLLPPRCEIDDNKYCFYKFWKKPDNTGNIIYAAGYYSYPDDPDVNAGIEYRSEHGAHAKADLLLHLFKEKIVDPTELSL